MKTNQEIGKEIRQRLLAQAAANRTSGDRLRAEVRGIWEQHPEFSAKEVIRCLPLGFQWVSVRRVQEILKDLRGESAAVLERGEDG
jgi:hypothetical protein